MQFCTSTRRYVGSHGTLICVCACNKLIVISWISCFRRNFNEKYRHFFAILFVELHPHRAWAKNAIFAREQMRCVCKCAGACSPIFPNRVNPIEMNKPIFSLYTCIILAIPKNLLKSSAVTNSISILFASSAGSAFSISSQQKGGKRSTKCTDIYWFCW